MKKKGKGLWEQIESPQYKPFTVEDFDMAIQDADLWGLLLGDPTEKEDRALREALKRWKTKNKIR